MEIKPLKLSGTFEIRFSPQLDVRGYFMRNYDEAIFSESGLSTSWVQESQSLSLQRDTIRGLHFQRPPFAETKLVQVIVGSVFDVFIDLRMASNTYGQWDSIELSSHAHNAVYIPKGFAHGFCTLTAETLIFYKMDVPYIANLQDGLIWNDTTLKIKWPTEAPIVSERDGHFRSFAKFISPF